jgi:hypothetical protein
MVKKMRQFFVLTCLLNGAIFFDASSQDTVALKYIESRIREIQPEGEMYYSTLPMQDYYQQFIDGFKDRIISQSGETLTLTKKEMSFLKRELRAILMLEYPDSLFPHSLRMSKESIIAFVDAKNRSAYDSLLNSRDRSKVRHYIRYWAFSFSRPIYIRESQLMIFYFMYFANSGGEHELSFYKKINGSWKFFALVSGGAW